MIMEKVTRMARAWAKKVTAKVTAMAKDMNLKVMPKVNAKALRHAAPHHVPCWSVVSCAATVSPRCRQREGRSFSERQGWQR